MTLRKASQWPALLVILQSTACSDPTGPVLQVGESCVGRSTNAVATFGDPQLEDRVRVALSVGQETELTCGRLALLRELDASSSGITSLGGVQNLVNLTSLDVGENSLGDVDPVSGLTNLSVLLAKGSGIGDIDGLTDLDRLSFVDLGDNDIASLAPLSGAQSLTFLNLEGNAIADLSGLSTLTGLRFLYLSDNDVGSVSPLGSLVDLVILDLAGNDVTDVLPLEQLTSLSSLDLSRNIHLTDIQPLLANTGLTGGSVYLFDTAVSCPDIAALRAGGVSVPDSSCP